MYTPGQCYLSVQLDMATIFAIQLDVTATHVKQAILGVGEGTRVSRPVSSKVHLGCGGGVG